MKREIIRIMWIISLFFVILFFRLFQMQIIKGEYYRKVSEENRIEIIYKKAPRGIIFDTNKNIMVNNLPSFNVVYIPHSMDPSLKDQTARLLGVLFNKNPSDIVQLLNFSSLSSFEPVVLASDIERNIAMAVLEQKTNMGGIDIDIGFMRRYMNNDLTAHLLGYVGRINTSEFERLGGSSHYKRDSIIGKYGLEKLYDNYLRGIDGGTCIEVTARGRQIKVINQIEPVPGNNMILNIDLKLQQVCSEALGSNNGTIIVMNPNTGAILAMISSPGFNPNLFIDTVDRRKKIASILKDSRYPMLNRAIQCQYAPGSIFKIITAICALEEGLISPNEKIECEGYLVLGKHNRLFRCWKENGHGKVDFKKALVESCDVYFYQLGLRIGVGKLAEYSRMFGLGELSGIDLPSEKKGIVPDRQWKRERLNEGWWDGDTLNMAIGQGYFLTTPLQMVNLMSIVANGGVFFKPRIVNRIESPQGDLIKEFGPVELSRVDISEKSWKILKDTLFAVIHDKKGTGSAAMLKSVSVAGKTGTAQNPQGDDHAWFTCYAPTENPEIALVVFVEHGGQGSVVAAPIARKILEYYFKEAAVESIPALSSVDIQ